MQEIFKLQLLPSVTGHYEKSDCSNVHVQDFDPCWKAKSVGWHSFNHLFCIELCYLHLLLVDFTIFTRQKNWLEIAQPSLLQPLKVVT